MNDHAQFVSYAQHGEDVVLWRALGDRKDVFYVDVGAFDPTVDSVTRALYERGWRGINIEPQPDLLGAFERERPEDTNLSLAIGDRDGTATLTRPQTAGWATTVDPARTGFDASTNSTFEVPMRRLDTLFFDLGVERVDVLKIDVEGAEPAVVRGLIESPIRPLVCVVEGVGPGVGRTAGDEAVSLLVQAGYVHCLFDGLNHYLTTDPSLELALSVPANPIDRHKPIGIVRLEQERHELHAAIAALAQENLTLRAVAAAVPAGQAESISPRPSGDAPVEKVAPVSAFVWQRSDLDPSIRTERRRSTFERLLQSDPASQSKLVAGPWPRLITLATTDLPSAQAISILYGAILGRDADTVGLAAWSARSELGEPLLDLARELAESQEARNRSPEQQAQVVTDLELWGRMNVLTELGVSDWHPHRSHSPGIIAHELFVESLFEVAHQRRPSPEESGFEIAKLVGGIGRESLLRAYAAHPDVRSRLLGTPFPGLLGRLRLWRGERRHVETFRSLVAAAEARQVAHLLTNLSTIGPSSYEPLPAKAASSKAR